MVVGTVKAQRIETNVLEADAPETKEQALTFDCADNSLYGKGLLWTGVEHTRQLVIQANPDRLWSSEDFDLLGGKSYMIDNLQAQNELGAHVERSSSRTVGTSTT